MFIRILGSQAEEDGIFIVWGNAQKWNNDVEILSFTCNGDVFHVYLDIQSMPSSTSNTYSMSMPYLEIGIYDYCMSKLCAMGLIVFYKSFYTIQEHEIVLL